MLEKKTHNVENKKFKFLTHMGSRKQVIVLIKAMFLTRRHEMQSRKEGFLTAEPQEGKC